MKTNVQTFCQEFSRELDPFASRLAESLGALSAQNDLSRIGGTLLNLREVQQRLGTLQDKISGQQAFLLIFGPLKSGKSTLMNAIAGAYVSEVSSLPAYPALVYVKHGEERRFEATTYEGKKRPFSDNLDMTNAVQDDHARLASAILDIERAGDDFDPRHHYPEAIRRIDIELPAPDLAESGTVLVDTPGLYSRMKFGYDQMTRDFRDTAACAIFVVKTDNLFFEKVFEEFEELLGCFSRIFLVSNIDTSKRDLKPDGSLEASLESRDPGKIIDAFRSLSMSASLRQAIDEGRLNIYSIDLLKAASRRLRQGLEQESEKPAADNVSWLDGESDDSALAEADEGREAGDGFELFLQDLTSYLNSSDYLNDFMFDSLRVAQDLGDETLQLVASRAAEELRQSADQLRESLDLDRRRLDALEQLERSAWSQAFAHLYDEKRGLLDSISGDHTRRLADILQEEVGAWMKSDESWNELLGRLNAQLQRESVHDAEALKGRVRTLVDNSQGGARFDTDQQENFRVAGLHVDEVARRLLPTLGEEAGTAALSLQLDRDEVPVRRTVGDVLLLRGGKQCRQQLFGKTGEEAIPASRKHKRLQGAGENWLKESVRDFAGEQLGALQNDYVSQVLNTYIKNFTQALQTKVAELKDSIARNLDESENRLASSEQASELLDTVRESAETFTQAIATLQASYGVEAQDADGEEADEWNAGNADAEAASLELEEEPKADGEDHFLDIDDGGLWEESRNNTQH